MITEVGIYNVIEGVMKPHPPNLNVFLEIEEKSERSQHRDNDGQGDRRMPEDVMGCGEERRIFLYNDPTWVDKI